MSISKSLQVGCGIFLLFTGNKFILEGKNLAGASLPFFPALETDAMPSCTEAIWVPSAISTDMKDQDLRLLGQEGKRM